MAGALEQGEVYGRHFACAGQVQVQALCAVGGYQAPRWYRSQCG